jgi:hypothetical protein
MPFTRNAQTVSLHFNDESASFMKALLEEKETSLNEDLLTLEDPELIAECEQQISICETLTLELKATVLISFGPEIWDQL